MDNKTKVKVAVVIGIVVLAVIFIFMVIFVKGNRMPVNKNIPKKTPGSYASENSNSVGNTTSNDEPSGEPEKLDDIVSIGIKGNNLVEIASDLNSKVIKELDDGYSDFCYGDEKVYVVYENDGVNSIVEIDLSNSSYPEKTLFSKTDYGKIDNLEYYGGKLYFVSENGALVEYSIEEEFAKLLTNENEVSHFTIDKNKNCLYISYKPSGGETGIYIFDLTSNSFTEIIKLSELSGEMILNGDSLIIDVKEYGRLYVYNSVSSTIVELGPNNNLEEAMGHVAFYSNFVVYTNGATIDIKDNSGNTYQDSWYVLDDGTIANISMISSTQLQISRFDDQREITRSIVIDISTGNTVEKPDTVYSDVIVIK